MTDSRNQIIVAMRGRGDPIKQRLEPRFDGVCNSITTVQKDNLIFEMQQDNEQEKSNNEYSNY